MKHNLIYINVSALELGKEVQFLDGQLINEDSHLFLPGFVFLNLTRTNRP